MGAAWRGLDGRDRGFKRILEMVKEVRGMGMEGEWSKSWRKGVLREGGLLAVGCGGTRERNGCCGFTSFKRSF